MSSLLQNSTNNLTDDISSFKSMLNGVTKLGFPLLWDGNAEFYSKEEYQNRLKEKINEEPKEYPKGEIEGVISGNQYFERLMPLGHPVKFGQVSKQFSRRWGL